jgi:hypothetical protein
MPRIKGLVDIRKNDFFTGNFSENGFSTTSGNCAEYEGSNGMLGDHHSHLT